MAPATLSSPPRITTGKTFSPRSASEKSTPPRTLPEDDAAERRHHRGDAPRQREDPLHAHPERQRDLLVVGRRPHRHPGEREPEEEREGGEQDHHHHEAPQVHRRHRHRPEVESAAGRTARGTGACRCPTSCSGSPRITLATPKVTMITEMIGSPMSGRSTPRSMTSPSTIATTSVSGQRHVRGAAFMLQDGGPRDVGAEEHQLARPEVDHARGLEDEDEPERHEGVHAAHGDAGDDQLEHEDDCSFIRSPSPRARLSRSGAYRSLDHVAVLRAGSSCAGPSGSGSARRRRRRAPCRTARIRGSGRRRAGPR